MARTDITGQTPTDVLTELVFTAVTAGVGNGARILNYNKGMLLLIRNPHATNPTGNVNPVASGTPPSGVTYTPATVTIAAGKIYKAKGLSVVTYEDADGHLLVDVAGAVNVEMAVLNCG